MTISNQSQPGWLTDEKWAAFLVEVEEQTAALVMNCTGGHPERASAEQRAGARTATFTAMLSKYRAIESERRDRQGQMRVEHMLRVDKERVEREEREQRERVDKAFADASEERKREQQAADARTSVALRNILVAKGKIRELLALNTQASPSVESPSVAAPAPGQGGDALAANAGPSPNSSEIRTQAPNGDPVDEVTVRTVFHAHFERGGSADYVQLKDVAEVLEVHQPTCHQRLC